MTRVLEAEREAGLAIEDARREVEHILRDARNRAERIASRTNTRIQAVHLRFREKLDQKKVDMMGEFQKKTGTQKPQWSKPQIRAAAKNLAADLTDPAEK